MSKIKVGILGATGIVGQRFIELLQEHPWFELTELAASEKSAHKSYEEVIEGRWRLGKIPEEFRKIKVKECKPNLDCKIVFSALDSSVAGHIEENFARNGYIVCSNSKNHRMDNDVPLLIPEVNAEHLSIIKRQKSRFGKGFIVTNPNCSAIGLVIALKPLDDAFGLKKVFVTTMQALSGAGYPGVASLDIIDNVIPYIGGEEEKIETESLKILGKVKNEKFYFANIKISAQCNRVNVQDGHLEAVNIKLAKKADLEQIKSAFKRFNPLKKLRLPNAPKQPIIVREEIDRPQPKFDRDLGNGMVITIGRIRKCNILDYKFLVLSHNTIRGAAGASILNAELMKVKGYMK